MNKSLRLAFMVCILSQGSVHAVAVETVGFAEALDQIVKRSPSVQKQQALLESVRSGSLSSRLFFLPSLSLQAQHLSSEVPGIVTSKQSVGGTATLNLFRFGSDAAGMDAATADIRSQEWTVEDTTIAAESEAVGTLVANIQASLELSTLRQIVETRKTAWEIANKRYQRGLLAAEEADAISIDLANAQSQLKDAEIAVLNARADLERLIGEGRVVATDWPWKTSFDSVVAKLSQYDAKALENRPDWRAAQQKVVGASKRVSQSWGTLFPSLDAQVSYGYARSDISGATTTGPEWTGTITVSVPLFDRLANYGDYRSRFHQKTAADMDLEKIQRLAKKEWESARSTLDISWQTAQEREKMLTLARKLYQANLKRFNRGLISANELRIDQDRLYQSELHTVRGWASLHTNFARLCHSLGLRLRRCMDEQR